MESANQAACRKKGKFTKFGQYTIQRWLFIELGVAAAILIKDRQLRSDRTQAKI